MVDYRVKVQRGEDGYYVVQCLEIPAAISQGRTQEEALRNIKEAIELLLEDIEDEIREKKPVVDY